VHLSGKRSACSSSPWGSSQFSPGAPGSPPHSRWLAEHPHLARRVKHVQRELQRLDDPIHAELLDRFDAIGRDDPPVATRAQEQDDITKIRERLDRLQRTHTIEPPGLSL
jgi:hypothetical protein